MVISASGAIRCRTPGEKRLTNRPFLGMLPARVEGRRLPLEAVSQDVNATSRDSPRLPSGKWGFSLPPRGAHHDSTSSTIPAALSVSRNGRKTH
jgi:hypothetical protein